MALENIVKRIKDEARKEAGSLIDEANRKAEAVKEEMDREIRKELEDRDRILSRDLANTRNIYVSDGKRKARQAVLSSKEEVIWDAICEIRKSIKELPQEKLGSHLLGLVEDARATLGEDMSIYPVREIDRRVLDGSGSIDGLLEGSLDSHPRLSRFKGPDLLGGFVAVNTSGNMVLDMTYRGIIERNEELLRELIARKLFDEE